MDASTSVSSDFHHIVRSERDGGADHAVSSDALAQLAESGECAFLAAWLDPLKPTPSNLLLLPGPCLPLLAAVAQTRNADAVRVLASFCDETLAYMGGVCRGGRSRACEDGASAIASAGWSCDGQSARASELLRLARETDRRLGGVLAEANRLLEQRSVRCVAQNRGTTCREAQLWAKEHGSPLRAEDSRAMPDAATGPTERGCPVVARRECPSTTARDGATAALAAAFEANLARIDDGWRHRAACRAWQDASTWCERTQLYAPPTDGTRSPGAP